MPSVIHKIQPTIKFFGVNDSATVIRKIRPTLKILGAGAASPDTAPPVVLVVSPPEGQIPGGLPSASKTPVVFTVQDIVPGFGFLRIRIRYTNGAQCTVHNGTDFEGPKDGRDGFKKNSTKTAQAFNKFTFTILPDNGWISAFGIEVDAIDAAGNIAT